jgi:adenylate cyclase
MPLQDSTPDLIPSADFDADALAPRELRVVLVCDVVESVRWMEQDEDYAVSRWQAFTQHVRSTIVPAHGGSVVKSTGDGMMVEFTNARSAVQAATALQAKASEGNATQAPERHLQLRTGIHETHARRDAHDLYGHGVNLAARITTLAGPGEIIVSAPVRDHLTDVLDGDIEDMGECYLKHIVEPQRVYRVGAASVQPVLVPEREYSQSLRPTIAVIPFESHTQEITYFAIGNLIADGVIAQLSRTHDLNVISRLSSAALQGRNASAAVVKQQLGAHYVLSGSYIVVANHVVINAELCECASGHILSHIRLKGTVDSLLELQSEVLNQIANDAHEKILNTEVSKSLAQPMPTLSSYSALLAAVTMMHRTSKADFSRSRALLELLIERHGKQAELPSWLAKWHVLQVEQGWADNKEKSARSALEQSQRALDLNPYSSSALAINGFVLCNLYKDFDTAQARYQEALLRNPSESIAWLLLGMLHAFKGESTAAVSAVDKAIALSPLDPTKYFYDSLAASVHLSAGNYEKSIDLAKRSLRGNATHVSTHRALTIAQMMAGKVSDAQSSAANLIKLDPTITVSKFLARSPGVKFGIGKTFADALRQAGVPA